MQKTTFIYSIYILLLISVTNVLLSMVLFIGNAFYLYLGVPIVLAWFMVGFKELFPNQKERLLAYIFTIYSCFFFIAASYSELDSDSLTKALFYGCFVSLALLIINVFFFQATRLVLVSMTLLNLNLWLTQI